MKSDAPKIWFPAKTYGWGWGPPVCWQGWVVVLSYILLMIAGAFFIFPAHTGRLAHESVLPKEFSIRIVGFIGYTLTLSFVLILICWKKGEKPRWRWGQK